MMGSNPIVFSRAIVSAMLWVAVSTETRTRTTSPFLVLTASQ